MKVSVHLRGGNNKTDVRALAIVAGLEAAGCTVKKLGRDEKSDAELIVQTGFGKTVALMGAIDDGKPYLIAEAPCFRGFYDIDKASNFTYCGLAGGGIRPPADKGDRPHPTIHTRTDGGEGTLIIGQKPTDHSLRGSDHVKWLLEKLAEYPEGTLRHHPLMVSPDSLRPLGEELSGYGHIVVWSSTVCVDALVAGNRVTAEGIGAEWDGKEDREEAIHRLSWSSFTHGELQSAEVGRYIASGYEMALQRAQDGQQEIPRERVDGKSICERYYRSLG